MIISISASHYGFQILNILIESGASLNIPGKEGEYPLEILAQRIKNVSKSTENDEIENCVTKMIAKGANPNITRKGRNSPIITAVKKQSESLVQIMLNARADILHVGEDHRTALDICFCNGKFKRSFTQLVFWRFFFSKNCNLSVHILNKKRELLK